MIKEDMSFLQNLEDLSKRQKEEELRSKTDSTERMALNDRFHEVFPLKKFAILDELDAGCFGLSYKALYYNFYQSVLSPVKPQETVVIKKLNFTVSSQEEYDNVVVDEIENYRGVRECEYVLKYTNFNGARGSEPLNFDYFLIHEFYPLTLKEYLVSQDVGLSPEEIKTISRKILIGLEYLHDADMIHGNLKSENILLSTDGEVVKLTDFGLSEIEKFCKKYKNPASSLPHLAPEVVLGGPHTMYSDTWSFACVIAEMYLMRKLFNPVNKFDLLDQIFQVIGTPDESVWPENALFRLSCFDNHPPLPLTSTIPELSDDILDILTKMLVFPEHDRMLCATASSLFYFQDFELLLNEYYIPLVVNRPIPPEVDRSLPLEANKVKPCLIPCLRN